jgi:hypothetical protein
MSIAVAQMSPLDDVNMDVESPSNHNNNNSHHVKDHNHLHKQEETDSLHESLSPHDQRDIPSAFVLIDNSHNDNDHNEVRRSVTKDRISESHGESRDMCV